MNEMTYRKETHYRCLHCGMTFNSEEAIKEHMDDIHNIQRCLGKYYCYRDDNYGTKTVEYIKVIGIVEQHYVPLVGLSVKYFADFLDESYCVNCNARYSVGFLLHECNEVDKEDFDTFFRNMVDHIEKMTEGEKE